MHKSGFVLLLLVAVVAFHCNRAEVGDSTPPPQGSQTPSTPEVVSPAVAEFVSECQAYFAGGPNESVLCKKLAAGSTAQELAPMTEQFRKTNSMLKKHGPDLAKVFEQTCIANAVGKKDLALIELCLKVERETGGIDRIAKGEGSIAQMRTLVDETATKDLVTYPTGNTPDDEAKRRIIIEHTVQACITEAPQPLVKIACSAVAAHEALKGDTRYGPNGELRKVFDQLVTVYGVATLPETMVRELVENQLRGIGVKEDVIAAMKDPVKGVQGAGDHLRREADKELNKIRDRIRIEGLPKLF